MPKACEVQKMMAAAQRVDNHRMPALMDTMVDVG